MDFAMIQATVSGLKTASDLAKGLLDLKTLAEMQGKVIELQSAILAAQSSALTANTEQAALLESLRQVNAEVERLKAWDVQSQRYKLITPWAGSLVYALSQERSNGQPPHWICTSCYEASRRSILNPVQVGAGWYAYRCPVCKSEIPSPYRSTSEAAYA